jgi:hypothetical protein
MDITQINFSILWNTAATAKASVRARKFADWKERRWLKAIDNAVEGLENNPWISLRPDGVLVWASETDPYVYEVTEHGCHCRAAQQHQPCKHLACRKLLLNYQRDLQFPVVPSRTEPSYLTELIECTERVKSLRAEVKATEIRFEGAQPRSSFELVANAPLAKRTVKGEAYGGIEI